MDYYKRTINVNDFYEIFDSTVDDFSGGTSNVSVTIGVMLTQKIEDMGIYDDFESRSKVEDNIVNN
jgi:hypothetical protein